MKKYREKSQDLLLIDEIMLLLTELKDMSKTDLIQFNDAARSYLNDEDLNCFNHFIDITKEFKNGK